jgi:hypothetical protein
MCRRPAAWLIDKEVFCEGHKELIIKAAGVDRFKIRRLTENERAFRSGGRLSRTIAVKKGAQSPHGEIVRSSHWERHLRNTAEACRLLPWMPDRFELAPARMQPLREWQGHAS